MSAAPGAPGGKEASPASHSGQLALFYESYQPTVEVRCSALLQRTSLEHSSATHKKVLELPDIFEYFVLNNDEDKQAPRISQDYK